MTRPSTSFSGPDLCALSARETVRVLKTGQVSATEVLEASEARIEQVEPAVNATVIRAGARARQQIEALAKHAGQPINEPGWLSGLPIAIKDLTLVSGLPATFGSLALKDTVAQTSDPLVERLETRGAIIVGKTNTPEFGAGGNTFNAVFGQTRNPWNTSRNAGGSSGGAAVSLATGEVWLSHGSDLAGSLRTPAAYCGVVGLRPTPGRCGGGPAATAFSIEGIAGPMARDTRDLALFLDAMAGYDPRHPISLDAPTVPFQTAIDAPDRPLRLAFSEDQRGFAPVEPEIREILRAAMEQVQSAGHNIDEACPDLPGLYDTYITLRGVHYGSINAYLPEAVQAVFKDTLRHNTETGRNLRASKIYDAMRQRTVLYHAMRQFLDGYDVLAIPVVGLEAGPAEQEFPPFVDGQPVTDYVDWLRFSFLATTTALPALSLPVGFTQSGMPVGLQLIGPPRGDAKLLHVARQIEDILALPTQPIDPIPG